MREESSRRNGYQCVLKTSGTEGSQLPPHADRRVLVAQDEQATDRLRATGTLTCNRPSPLPLSTWPRRWTPPKPRPRPGPLRPSLTRAAGLMSATGGSRRRASGLSTPRGARCGTCTACAPRAQRMRTARALHRLCCTHTAGAAARHQPPLRTCMPLHHSAPRDAPTVRLARSSTGSRTRLTQPTRCASVRCSCAASTSRVSCPHGQHRCARC